MFKKFLVTLDGRVPAELDVHLICELAGFAGVVHEARQRRAALR